MTLLLLALACSPKTVSPPAALGGPERTPEEVTGLPAELVVEGALADRVSTEGADLVIHYAGEHAGSMETCGCPKRPRGSLPRLAAYRNAAIAAWPDTPHLLVHGGNFMANDMGLDGELRADAPVQNAWMLKGLEAAGFDAVNVAYPDLPGLIRLQEFPDQVVSANIVAMEGALPLPRTRIVSVGNLTVGITGVTANGITFLPTPQYRVADPVENGVQALKEMADTADVLVLLVFEATDAVEQILAQVPQMDLVVVETRMFRDFTPPMQRGGAIVTRSHFQTQRLGELRLAVGEDGISVVRDRKIDMDPEVPDDPALMSLLLEARGELEVIQAELFGTP